MLAKTKKQEEEGEKERIGDPFFIRRGLQVLRGGAKMKTNILRMNIWSKHDTKQELKHFVVEMRAQMKKLKTKTQLWCFYYVNVKHCGHTGYSYRCDEVKVPVRRLLMETYQKCRLWLIRGRGHLWATYRCSTVPLRITDLHTTRKSSSTRRLGWSRRLKGTVRIFYRQGLCKGCKQYLTCCGLSTCPNKRIVVVLKQLQFKKNV